MTDDTPRLLTPQLELVAQVGEGAMGTVYRGRDTVLNRVVAVKILRSDLLSSSAELQRAMQRFEREAQVMARIEHPSVIDIYDAGLTDRGEPYLVMKFVQGKSCSELLKEGPLEPRLAARWWSDVASGLQACHDAGVVHRDVKPSNVMIDQAGNALLTDFGIALDGQAHTRLTQSKVAVGTLNYMPPEQVSSGTADGRSDVYSVGASLYEALTREPVFRGAHMLELLARIAAAPPRPLRDLRPELPVDLEAIVLHCLEKKPEDRYPTAQALAEDLERYLAGEPVVAADHRARRVTRKRAVAWVCATSLLIACALVALWVARNQRAEAGLNAHLKWDAEELAPRALGLLERPDPPSVEDLDGRLETLNAHMSVLGDAKGRDARERLVAYRRWRSRSPDDPVPEVSNSRSAVALVVDARILAERGDLRRAEARLRRVQKRRPGFRPAVLLELLLLSRHDPAGLVRRAGFLELEESRTFALDLMRDALAPLWEQAVNATLAKEADGPRLLETLSKGASLTGNPRTLAEAKFAALQASTADWTQQLTDLARATHALEGLVRILATPPRTDLPNELHVAIDDGLGIQLESAKRSKGSARETELVDRAMRFERLAFERVAPRLRQEARMRELLSVMHAQTRQQQAIARASGSVAPGLDAELVLAHLRYGSRENPRDLAEGLAEDSVERVRRSYPESRAVALVEIFRVLNAHGGSLAASKTIAECVERIEDLAVAQGREDLDPFALGWLRRSAAVELIRLRRHEESEDARGALGRRAHDILQSILESVRGVEDPFGNRTDLTRSLEELIERVTADK